MDPLDVLVTWDADTPDGCETCDDNWEELSYIIDWLLLFCNLIGLGGLLSLFLDVLDDLDNLLNLLWDLESLDSLELMIILCSMVSL